MSSLFLFLSQIKVYIHTMHILFPQMFHPPVLPQRTQLKPLLASAILAFALLIPGSASAFCIYNASGIQISARVLQGDFKKEISKGGNACCHWSNRDCNPDGKVDSHLTVQIETDLFNCVLPMQAGGYARFYQEGRSHLGLPADNYCVTYNADDKQHADSRRRGRTEDRNVRFLVTADPQYDNSDIKSKKVSDQTLESMIRLLRDNSQVRGIVIAGDLTQNTRSNDEFAWYKEAISGFSRFVFDGLGNHDLFESTTGQDFVCVFNPDICVDPDRLRDDIANRKRATVVTNKKGPHYSWDWQDVHFVQLNLFPGNEPAPQYPQFSPQNSLDFLRHDLAQYVGDSGRPVVLIHHYGLDDFSGGRDTHKQEWWTAAQQAAYWDVIAPYNVVALFTGHDHLKEGSSKEFWQVPFNRPADRTTGPASIPTFISGATLNGVFLDVILTQTSLQVLKRKRDGTPAADITTLPLRTNLAWGKAASQSSVHGGGIPSRAVDGNWDGNWSKGSVTHTQKEPQPWWQVDLGSVQQVGTVVLYNRTDCCAERLSNFRLLVSENGEDWHVYAYPGPALSQARFQVDRAARYVKVQLNGTNWLSLAEVQIFAPPNLALGKTATQSSTDYKGDPSRAVDGNWDGEWSRGSVTHTQKEFQPWWQVDLGKVQRLKGITLYNRTDCCKDRLSNFRLLVSENGRDWHVYPHPDPAPGHVHFRMDRAARYVKVQLNGTNALSLAEVVVF